MKYYFKILLHFNLRKEGINMAKCEKCGVEVPTEDLYEAHGLKVCEVCELKSASSSSPSTPCGGEK
jgi:formylmethanofuran dehydrogenase subunit E